MPQLIIRNTLLAISIMQKNTEDGAFSSLEIIWQKLEDLLGGLS